MKLIPLTPLARGLFAKVDDADFERLADRAWMVVKDGNTFYAYHRYRDETGKRTSIAMHRLILGLERSDKRFVDHKDSDGLNNQRENIRACTPMQNRWNSTQGNLPLAASGYRGVEWRKDRGHWRWIITCNGRWHTHGPYATAKEAAIARELKVKELHGEFARSQLKEKASDQT